jgi:nucleoside-diphosphate-sugar epimerase
VATVLVTGGAGFIGSQIAEALSAEHEVRVLDSFVTGRRENLDGLDVEVIEGSILDSDMCLKAMDGCDAVFHEAAIPRVPRSVEFPVESHEANATGTLCVLEGARAAGVKRVVYASSSSVYGDTPTLPKHEQMPVSPRSPYAASKLAGEAYCRAYTASYGLATVSLRYFNVFGPRQDPASKYGAAPPNFASRLLSGQPPLIYGDGEQTRDFTYVGDVVAANIAAWRAPAEKVAGAVFNVGAGTRNSVNHLFRLLRDLTGATDVEAEHTDPRTGDVRDTLADVGAITGATGWRPSVSLDDGCRRLVEWLQASPERIVAFAS